MREDVPMNDHCIPDPSTKAAPAWGLVAGLVGSLCCIGPSTAALLGLGSSSMLFSVQFNQRWALIVSGMLLLGGIARVLRPVGICRRPGWHQPAIMLATFGIAYGLLGGLLPTLAAQVEDRRAAPVAVNASQEIAVERPAAPALHRLTLIIEKMNCPPCAVKIRNRLSGKPAVRELRAEAYNEEVIITYDPQQTTGEALIKLIPTQYGVTFIRDEPVQ
jgi:hypothetical protein